MAMIMKIKGMDKVLKKLSKSKAVTAAGVERGLKQAGLFLQAHSQRICPIDTGNLRGSAFTRNAGGRGFKADIVVGYTANYAVYVHENLQARHKPPTQAKYLEQPAREKKDKIFRIIRTEAKI